MNGGGPEGGCQGLTPSIGLGSKDGYLLGTLPLGSLWPVLPKFRMRGAQEEHSDAQRGLSSAPFREAPTMGRTFPGGMRPWETWGRQRGWECLGE